MCNLKHSVQYSNQETLVVGILRGSQLYKKVKACATAVCYLLLGLTMNAHGLVSQVSNVTSRTDKLGMYVWGSESSTITGYSEALKGKIAIIGICHDAIGQASQPDGCQMKQTLNRPGVCLEIFNQSKDNLISRGFDPDSFKYVWLAWNRFMNQSGQAWDRFTCMVTTTEDIPNIDTGIANWTIDGQINARMTYSYNAIDTLEKSCAGLWCEGLGSSDCVGRKLYTETPRCIGSCRANTDCPNNTPICNTQTKTCLSCKNSGGISCPSGTSCTDSGSCETVVAAPVTCAGNSTGCPASTPICGANGSCGICNTTTHPCPNGSTCSGGKCVRSCN